MNAARASSALPAAAAAAVAAGPDPHPPQPLLDALDAVTPADLGLTPAFLAAAATTSPTMYILAHSPGAVTLGFVLLSSAAPAAPFQLFRAAGDARRLPVATRLLAGRARLRLVADAPPPPDTSPSRKRPRDEPAALPASVARAATATGPWPALALRTGDLGVEYAPLDAQAAAGPAAIAVFYAAHPSLIADELPRYLVRPAPANRDVSDDGGGDGDDHADMEDIDRGCDAVSVSLDPRHPVAYTLVS